MIKEQKVLDQEKSGYPSAGRIAWALWGGDAGQTWSNKKVDQLDRERNKFLEDLASELTDENFEEKQLTAAVRDWVLKRK